jgi:hypothetical protein
MQRTFTATMDNGGNQNAAGNKDVWRGLARSGGKPCEPTLDNVWARLAALKDGHTTTRTNENGSGIVIVRYRTN